MDPACWCFNCHPKPRMSHADGDYFNIMPAMYETENIDKVFTDEIEQIRGFFKYFDEFHSLANVTDVLKGAKEGRTNDQERILVYNYGIAIHDLYFAMKLMNQCNCKDVEYNCCREKFFL